MTDRDREILRTLARVKVLSTAMVQGTLFSHKRVAQRRFAHLASAGLIARHSRGLPQAETGGVPHYWRLTPLGASAVEYHFPDEGDVAAVAERAQSLSLRNHEHQGMVAGLYLRLIADKDFAEVRRKAGRLRFVGDYETSLSCDRGGTRRRLVPDAVLTTRDPDAVRVFVELDRSTESHKRIEEVVRSYAACMWQGTYAEAFSDGKRPRLLYVTKTRARRERLTTTLRRVETGEFPVEVVTDVEAPERLCAALFRAGETVTGEESEAPGADRACDDAITREVSDERTLLSQTASVLRDLYADYCREIERQKASGSRPAVPASLQRSYQLLTALAAEAGA
jgi:hypothetical protein